MLDRARHNRRRRLLRAATVGKREMDQPFKTNAIRLQLGQGEERPENGRRFHRIEGPHSPQGFLKTRNRLPKRHFSPHRELRHGQECAAVWVKVIHGRFCPKKLHHSRLGPSFVPTTSKVAATITIYFKISVVYAVSLQEQVIGSYPLIHVEMEAGLTATMVDRL